ncbi:MAG: glycosyltransferase family 2 protein [Xenococcaceae cyanobacterium MO_188.B19]|nr:glycosyltransferase family 2 protein [Xenococcaceae cyanobacterium MO_188.B19]
MNYLYTRLNNNKLNKKVTIFSVPKPFVGHIGIIQYNAIASWSLLTPRPEIILFGNETGTAAVAKKFNLIHIPEVRKNQYGTPLLDDIFAYIHHQATKNIITYVNTDIILISDFSLAVQSVAEDLEDYLLIGRRWNIEINKVLDFNSGWESRLSRTIKEKASLAQCDCKDYFVFPKHLFGKIPPFAVGRGYWDTWMVRKALDNGYPVVDSSLAITAIHQNHSYLHMRGGRNEAYVGEEAQINKSLGNLTKAGDISCATWQLKPKEYQNSPTVSVVIKAQNRSESVEKTVLSVLTQNYENYEIIVIDSSSNKEIIRVLEPYQSEIQYYRLETSSVDTSYNYGLKVAQGEFITFLDEGSIFLPGALGNQIACFESEASTLDIVLSGCKVFQQGKVTEYKPWQDLPNLETLRPSQLNLTTQLLTRYSMMLRRSRLEMNDYYTYDLTQTSNQLEIISNLIFTNGCRASWLKSITQIQS